MKQATSMESLQAERNALLTYVLQHPPAGVTVHLPHDVRSLNECDLSKCPLPLKLYAEAESAGGSGSAHRLSSGLVEFNLGDYVTSTFAAGGGGGVARQPTMNGGGGRFSPPPPTPRKSGDKTAAAVDGKDTGSAGDGHTEVAEEGRLTGAPPPAVKTGSGGAHAHGGSKGEENAHTSGFMGFVGNLFNSGAAAYNDGEKVEKAGKLEKQERSEKAAKGEKQSAEAQASSTSLTPNSAGAHFLNFFSRMRVHHGKGMPSGSNKCTLDATGACRLPAACANASEVDSKEIEKIPLNGTFPGTLADYILPKLEPLLRNESGTAATPANNAASQRCHLEADGANSILPASVLQPTNVRDPTVIELCPVLDQSMLGLFDDEAMVSVYEILLMSVNFLLDVKKDLYETEIFSVYRPMFGVSEDEHMRCMVNLIPAHLREGSVNREELRWYLEGLRPDVRTIRAFIHYSSDEEFVHRMNVLLDTAVRYADEPGQGDQTLLPLAVRASIFAVSLIPIYRLNPKTQKPTYSAWQVEHCVANLQHKLQIPADTVEYCHLHARLLANDEGVNKSMQCVFLKHVARAVNALGARVLEKSTLTPDVKYAFYVLQETLGVAMAPMPWLDTLCKGSDSKRSVSAVFCEACAVLPTCFLAAFVRVNGRLVLPPSCSPGAFLYAFLSMFVSSVTLRQFGDAGDALMKSMRTRHRADRLRLMGGVLTSLTDLDRFARDYLELLERSLPMAPCLVLEGRFGLGNHALDDQWTMELRDKPASAPAAAAVGGGEKKRAPPSEPVPDTVAEDVSALLKYLVAVMPPTIASVSQDPEVRLVVAAAAARNLAAVGAMVTRSYNAHFASLAARLEEAEWKWGTATTASVGCEELSEGLAALVDSYGSAKLPPPLGPAPHELQLRRLRGFVDNVTALVKKLSLPLPSGAIHIGRPGLTGASHSAGGDANIGGGADTSGSATPTAMGNHKGGNPASGGGVSGSVSGGSTSSIPRAFVEFHHLRQLRAVGKPLQELLQRLSALYRLQQACVKFFSESAAQYRQVSSVTGSAPVHYEKLWSHTDSALADAISGLCRWVAAAVVCDKSGDSSSIAAATGAASSNGSSGAEASDETCGGKKATKKAKGKHGDGEGNGSDNAQDGSLYGTMLNQFMRMDVAAYKQQKHRGLPFFGGGSKEKMLETPLPRAYPSVTVNGLMAQLDEALERCVVGHVQQPHFRQEIRSCAATFFVSMLHTVYLEDVAQEVFLVPADTDAILRDLDGVSRHYFGSHHSPSDTDGEGGGGGGRKSLPPGGLGSNLTTNSVAALGENSRGARMLSSLRGVVHYVMMRSSATLVNGGDGVPRFSTLPDYDANTPWCKYVVRRVLAHRKDKTAKQALSKWFE